MKNADTSSNSLRLDSDKDNNTIVNIPPETDFNAVYEGIKNEQANKFPVNVFPAIFSNLINECRESLNFPPDYTGIAILTAVATAIGTSAKIKVKAGWYEFPALYSAIIGNAGTNKSHPLSLVFDIFNSIDKKAITEYELLYNEYDEYQSLSKKDKAQCSKVEEPVLLKSILNNFTPEVLHQRLSDNLRGCTVVSDELATFLEGMNNYSKGDQASTYLTFWSNKPTSIDRVSKPIPLFIQQPFLNIIGSLQPRILNKLFPVNKTDNGFLQRFLFAFPNDIEKYPINDTEMDEALLQQYNQFISDYINQHPIIVNADSGKPESKLYYWSNDSKAYFYEWQRLNTIEVNHNADTLKGEIISKFDIHFVRLALILQIMGNSNTNEIGLNAVSGADALCKYFTYNAFKVLDILKSLINSKDSLPLNKLKFYEALPNEFTTGTANEIGATNGLNEKFVQRFISDPIFFRRVSQGNYCKINL